MKIQVQQHLNSLQQALINANLWENTPPTEEALASTEPFCIDTLSVTQWLQWIFIPRMNAILEANVALPNNFAITPYLEEALKESEHLVALSTPLLALEQLLKVE